VQRFRLCAQHSPVLCCRPGMWFSLGSVSTPGQRNALFARDRGRGSRSDCVSFLCFLGALASTMSPISKDVGASHIPRIPRIPTIWIAYWLWMEPVYMHTALFLGRCVYVLIVQKAVFHSTVSEWQSHLYF